MESGSENHQEKNVDARTVSLVRSGLAVAADAMGIAAIRAAYSTTIKGGADASSGIFDTRGRLVALSETSMVGHLAPLRYGVQSVLSDFPPLEMNPGDVFAMNDPYRGGVHSNDVQIFVPVFVEGTISYMTGTMVHVADLGGTAAGGLSGTVTDMFQEGLTLPPVRLYRAGVAERDVHQIITANTRTPEVTLGDIRALIAGARIGARELGALVTRLGPDGPSILSSAIEELIAQSEAMLRQRIAQLGPLCAVGEAIIDDDGVRIGHPLRVKVKLTVEKDTMTIDFTGTDAQALGPINAPQSPAISATLFGALALLDDPDVAINDGIFAPFEIIRPEGSLVAPLRPAAVNARGMVSGAIVDSMLDALVTIRPDRGTAGSGLNHVITASMTDSSGRTRSFHDRDYGGTGARYGADGVDAHGYAFFHGRANATAIEVVERDYPVRYEHLKLREGSGGKGRWNGGRGVQKTMRLLSDATITVRTDRIVFPPNGATGGDPGAAGGWVINYGSPDERWLRSKETNVPVKAGDTFTMLTSGGGGFGSSEESDAKVTFSA